MTNIKLTEEQKELLHKLNPRQQKFVCNLVSGMNQTQAYKEAGYKPKSDEQAKVMASRLLTNVNVKAAYEALMKPKAEDEAIAAIATKDEVKKILTSMARRELDPFSQSHSDKIAAIRLMAKICGWEGVSEKDKAQNEAISDSMQSFLSAINGNTIKPEDE